MVNNKRRKLLLTSGVLSIVISLVAGIIFLISAIFLFGGILLLTGEEVIEGNVGFIIMVSFLMVLSATELIVSILVAVTSMKNRNLPENKLQKRKLLVLGILSIVLASFFAGISLLRARCLKDDVVPLTQHNSTQVKNYMSRQAAPKSNPVHSKHAAEKIMHAQSLSLQNLEKAKQLYASDAISKEEYEGIVKDILGN